MRSLIQNSGGLSIFWVWDFSVIWSNRPKIYWNTFENLKKKTSTCKTEGMLCYHQLQGIIWGDIITTSGENGRDTIKEETEAEGWGSGLRTWLQGLWNTACNVSCFTCFGIFLKSYSLILQTLIICCGP